MTLSSKKDFFRVQLKKFYESCEAFIKFLYNKKTNKKTCKFPEHVNFIILYIFINM